ncbi:lysozyme inhibitor LprI family protein [Type-D symbiont of Plautia stali]|uniref:lysozyme inhibitor LprI family protein n=1 Tax=Type-D symbiont of Plautia stali TaxID=1560356 RepID=UPI00073E43B8|nr:lysozyme inhibitor LprI family protein [Type-D symbiont of Plautia stali]
MNAHAGFFSSSDDFKCGRDDTIQALQKSLKDNASEILQSRYISSGSAYFYNKPEEVLQQEINATSVTVSNITTSDASNGIQCTATVSVKVSPAALTLSKEMPDQFAVLKSGSGTLLNNNLVWKRYSYRAQLADNKKDIIIENLNSIPEAIYNNARHSVNSENILDSNVKYKRDNALRIYEYRDGDLNALWKTLPASLRTSIKSEQQEWVKSKAKKCGTIEFAKSDVGDMKPKVETLLCQTKMTEERITYLGGSLD